MIKTIYCDFVSAQYCSCGNVKMKYYKSSCSAEVIQNLVADCLHVAAS